MKRTLLFTLLFSSVLAASLIAQTTPEMEGRDALFRPKIGLGGGVFTFFGDVQDTESTHIFTASKGYHVSVSRNINQCLDAELRVLYGDVAVNERGERNLNFRSTIWNGSANLILNFNRLYKRPRVLQPFISAGVAYLNFNSKTDLFDASGNRYHYWEDGTIRDIPEDSPLAETAVEIQRDYEYETDLREQNLDGLGDYNQYALSIPLSAGVDFHVSKRFTFSLGGTFFYNFTDLIDNVSDAGEGMREGDSNNDHLLYTNFTLKYSLWNYDPKESAKEAYYSEVDFCELITTDSDKDGVFDWDDECDGPVDSLKVDAKGCPLDSDGDGVPDYRDKAKNAPNALVDADGVPIDEDDLGTTKSALPRDAVKGLPLVEDINYTVHVGTYTEKQVPGNVENKLENIPGVQKRRINDTLVVYTTGRFNQFEEAVQRQKELLDQGLNEAFGVNATVVNEVGQELEKLDRRVDKVFFKVRLEEYRSEEVDYIQDLISRHGMEFMTTKGGLKIYTIGSFPDLESARELKEEIVRRGLENAEVVAFRNYNQISLEEAKEFIQRNK